MAEHVRLVIWDLDETFWRGTLSEGGITEYLQANHDIVVALARRGIISSVCSKNDKATCLDVLRSHGLLDYIVFPSISWDPKGPRIARLIERIGLRAPSVLFIDDNPNNRAEAAAFAPGLQTENELFIASLLGDPRCAGRHDPALMRLAQYRLLERRAADEAKDERGNEAFLWSCGIRVFIDADVENNLGRAVELVNRTNQLNFTRRRLPEDEAKARAELLRQLARFDVQAGLVHVWDRYGDYGVVGFFLVTAMRQTIVEGAANTRLEHFCFSCRTLGMRIEQWVYAHLGFPEITAAADTVAPLVPGEQIGWVTPASGVAAAASDVRAIAPKIIVTGGCEAHAVGAYLGAHAPAVQVVGNYAAGALFTRMNTATVLLDMADRKPRAFAAEAARLGLPAHLEILDIFSEENEGACYLMSCGLDIGYHHLFRHQTMGWTLYLEPRADCGVSLLAPEEDIQAHIEQHPHFYDEDKRAHLLAVSRHMRENYRALRPETTPRARIQEVIERMPKGARLVLVAPHDETRPHYPDEAVARHPEATAFADMLRDLTSEYDYATMLRIGDAITSPDDIREADHFARQVYLRIARMAVDRFEQLSPRADHPRQQRMIIGDMLAAEARARRVADSREVVDAAFRTFLQRPPENWGFADALVHGHITLKDFITGMAASDEFKSHWKKLP